MTAISFPFNDGSCSNIDCVENDEEEEEEDEEER